MEHKQIVVAIIALVIGVGIGYLLNGAPAQDTDNQSTMHHEMAAMTAGLEGKTGDEFDKAFLVEMIVHHEGAVDMAEAALKNAAHPELRTMATAIIAAQTAEIARMKEWLRSWYGQ